MSGAVMATRSEVGSRYRSFVIPSRSDQLIVEELPPVDVSKVVQKRSVNRQASTCNIAAYTVAQLGSYFSVCTGMLAFYFFKADPLSKQKALFDGCIEQTSHIFRVVKLSAHRDFLSKKLDPGSSQTLLTCRGGHLNWHVPPSVQLYATGYWAFLFRTSP
jgi:hypothetical protein